MCTLLKSKWVKVSFGLLKIQNHRELYVGASKEKVKIWVDTVFITEY